MYALCESENAGSSEPSPTYTSSCAPLTPAKRLPSVSSNALPDMSSVSGPSRRYASTSLLVCSPVRFSAIVSVSELGTAAPARLVRVLLPATATPPALISEASIRLSNCRRSVPVARSSSGAPSSAGRTASIRSALENESDSGAPGAGRPCTVVLLEAPTVPPRSRNDDSETYPKSGEKSPYCAT